MAMASPLVVRVAEVSPVDSPFSLDDLPLTWSCKLKGSLHFSCPTLRDLSLIYLSIDKGKMSIDKGKKKSILSLTEDLFKRSIW